MARKPAKTQTQMERDINLDRDMQDIVARLRNIENSVQNIIGRDAVIAAQEFKITALEKRVGELEAAKSTVIKMVMGSVGVALLSLVVGGKVLS